MLEWLRVPSCTNAALAPSADWSISDTLLAKASPAVEGGKVSPSQLRGPRGLAPPVWVTSAEAPALWLMRDVLSSLVWLTMAPAPSPVCRIVEAFPFPACVPFATAPLSSWSIRSEKRCVGNEDVHHWRDR